MRLNYSEDEDFTGQFALWEANTERSIAGKRGQAALRELEAALVAMPRKRLIREAVADAQTGDVCAVGALSLSIQIRQGVDPKEALARLEAIDPDDTEGTTGEAERLGIPRMVAWRLVALNDLELEDRFATAEGPMLMKWLGYQYQAGYRVSVEVTPEERYEGVLAWVRSKLKDA
jgi:hypothetical protein